ncbi:hypothetical protein VHA_002688 [Grimontia hollisae CIP 101886]|uniref:Uncharacterized protein n=1 Tax=Grimontia hollisae CIP 101886 TaxID=675812 RepID=D0IAB1_GRIHO|nr:hypothetical protein VHA_002688 [Grimontia hollisae CIP 101886]
MIRLCKQRYARLLRAKLVKDAESQTEPVNPQQSLFGDDEE